MQRRAREGELVFGIVGLEDIFDDCTTFPEFDVMVWVVDGWCEAVGIDLGGEGWFFEVRGSVDFVLPGDGEFFEDYGYFPWVWAGW